MYPTQTNFEEWVENHQNDVDFLHAEFIMELTTTIMDEVVKQRLTITDLVQRLGWTTSKVGDFMQLGPKKIKDMVEMGKVLNIRFEVMTKSLKEK